MLPRPRPLPLPDMFYYIDIVAADELPVSCFYVFTQIVIEKKGFGCGFYFLFGLIVTSSKSSVVPKNELCMVIYMLNAKRNKTEGKTIISVKNKEHAGHQS